MKAVPTQKYNLAARRLRLGGIESSYPIFARDNRTSPRIFNSSGGAGSRFAQEGRKREITLIRNEWATENKLIHRRMNIFYGWWIVAISFVVHSLSTGLYWLGFSVFFLPISR
ncbi:MAG: hypothetical protein VX608_11515, partial [Chloroflexota bacterium]|nr:hypothetical protein [Chloroflexota bacterium]